MHTLIAPSNVTTSIDHKYAVSLFTTFRTLYVRLTHKHIWRDCDSSFIVLLGCSHNHIISPFLSNQVFVAHPFSPDEEWDETIETIKQAVIDSGYTPMCLKYEEYPETIMTKAMSEIRKSILLIVNLSQDRSAVVYEAGFAAGLDIPCMFICRTEDKGGAEQQFYARHYKIHYYDDQEKLGKLVEAFVAGTLKS